LSGSLCGFLREVGAVDGYPTGPLVDVACDAYGARGAAGIWLNVTNVTPHLIIHRTRASRAQAEQFGAGGGERKPGLKPRAAKLI
jgi:hypothetical protein